MDKFQDLIAQVLQLSADERRRFLTLLTERAEGHRVADAGAPPYGIPDPTSGVTQLQGSRDMKSLTVVLPDDLIKRAQAAGLFSDGRLEDLIRRALEEPGTGRTMSASSGTVSAGRRLIRQNGHLVVEALEGERPVNDADVKDALDRMEW